MLRRREPDLLDWQPPQPVASFDPPRVRATGLPARLAKAIGIALEDCGFTRDVVADRMSDYLGRRVSKNMLDAYASEARAEHIISTPRFAALVHATLDRRLLEMLAAPFGWAVIDRKYLPLIELAAVQDRRDELDRQAHALRRQARSGGLL